MWARRFVQERFGENRLSTMTMTTTNPTPRATAKSVTSPCEPPPAEELVLEATDPVVWDVAVEVAEVEEPVPDVVAEDDCEVEVP